MSAHYLKTLERRADELQKELKADPRYTELEALKVAIEAHKQAAKAAAQEVKALRVVKPAPAPEPSSESSAAVRYVIRHDVPLPEPKQSRGKMLVDAAIELLRQERKYLNSTQLAERLRDRGYDLTAKSTPQAYLAAHLSSSRIVENIKGHGYGLVEWRVPSAEVERAH